MCEIDCLSKSEGGQENPGVDKQGFPGPLIMGALVDRIGSPNRSIPFRLPMSYHFPHDPILRNSAYLKTGV